MQLTKVALKLKGYKKNMTTNKKMTLKELQQIIIDNFYNEQTQEIDLRHLNFKDYRINLSCLQARSINNQLQIATDSILNCYQYADIIDNLAQSSITSITNVRQRSYIIDNYEQIGTHHINNNLQLSTNIFNTKSEK